MLLNDNIFLFLKTVKEFLGARHESKAEILKVFKILPKYMTPLEKLRFIPSFFLLRREFKAKPPKRVAIPIRSGGFGDFLHFNLLLNHWLDWFEQNEPVDVILYDMNFLKNKWKERFSVEEFGEGYWQEEVDNLYNLFFSLLEGNHRIASISVADGGYPTLEYDFVFTYKQVLSHRYNAFIRFIPSVDFFIKLHEGYTEYNPISDGDHTKVKELLGKSLMKNSKVIVIQLRNSIQSPIRNVNLEHWRKVLDLLLLDYPSFEFIIMYNRDDRRNFPLTPMLTTGSERVHDINDILPSDVKLQMALLEQCDLFLGCSSGPVMWAYFRDVPAVLGGYVIEEKVAPLFSNGKCSLGGDNHIIVEQDDPEILYPVIQNKIEMLQLV